MFSRQSWSCGQLCEIASTEKIAQEKFFFQGGREKIGFFREIKMVYGSIARPERSKLGSFCSIRLFITVSLQESQNRSQMSAAAEETHARCGLAPLGCACGAPPGARTASCGARHGV